jgi:hypothetical protein
LEDSIIATLVFNDQEIEATEKIVKIKYGKMKMSIESLNFLLKIRINIVKAKTKNERKTNLGTSV